MKKYITLFLVMGGFLLSSCEDFLQREPLDFGNENIFLKSTKDMAYFANTFYSLFPSNKSYMNGGPYRDDENSDNQTSFWSNSNFYPGVKEVPKLGDNSAWKFTTIRQCNYFINLIRERIENKEITGTEKEINHYLGEVYFFRAYDYYRLLTNYGDVPIIDKVLPDDISILKVSTRRAPRNEVARFMIRDLEIADSLMMETAPSTGRLSRDCARLMLARVALFEATWEKYHAGTCFVPGNAKWVGAKMHPDFTFKAGSAEAEINFFLDKAIEYSDMVAKVRPLCKDYKKMFTSDVIDTIPEVLLAKSYVATVNGHGVNRALSLAGKTGYTRSLVESFLMNNGLPIYAAGDYYQSDITIERVLAHRDNRLVESLNNVFLPRIGSRDNEYTPTGYQVSKWLKPDQAGSETGGTTANPIFRSAEAYCIYLEAYYERHKDLGGNCDSYWRALRDRAKTNSDYMLTISRTDLSQERDLAAKTKGIDATLYNIRRERRCEFIAEGMRLNDLKRWRALDNMVNYDMMGMNLWDVMFRRYANAEPPITLKEDVISQYDPGDPESKYIRVFRVNESDKAYNGYNFPKPHYLEPIPLSEILLTAGDATDLENSNIYQNPGWPIETGSVADYTYDCD